MNLYQIKTPENAQRPFCVGLCVDAKGDVWQAAGPINWMKGKPISFVISYCKLKGWSCQRVA